MEKGLWVELSIRVDADYFHRFIIYLTAFYFTLKLKIVINKIDYFEFA